MFWRKKQIKRSIYTKDIFKGSRYDIGEYTYGEPQIIDWNIDSDLVIGKFCSIAKGVKIFLDGNHRVDWISTFPFNRLSEDFQNAIDIFGHPSTKGPVKIGNDVWIGSDVIILSGVKIGDGAVIGAGSVVSKDIDPYSIVVGNPAKEVKKRFSQNQILELLEIAWWDWPTEKIDLEVRTICSSNIESFIKKNKIQ